MRHHQYSSARRVVAVATAICLVLPPFVEAFGAQAPPASAPSAAKPAPAAAKATPVKTATKAPAATSAPVDGGWPKAFSTPTQAELLMYQPQIASWDKQQHLVAYSAVSYFVKGAQKPALGTVKVESDTKVAVDDR